MINVEKLGINNIFFINLLFDVVMNFFVLM